MNLAIGTNGNDLSVSVTPLECGVVSIWFNGDGMMLNAGNIKPDAAREFASLLIYAADSVEALSKAVA